MLSIVPCTTRILLPTGEPATGALSFVLSEPMEDTSTGTIVAAVPQSVPLDATGSIVVNLVANDDSTTITASGTPAFYNVSENLVGQAAIPYKVSVPSARAGQMTQLAAIRVV